MRRAPVALERVRRVRLHLSGSSDAMKFAALACTLVIALAACSKLDGSATKAGRHAWTQPGVLRVAVVEEPKSLNPLLAFDQRSTALSTVSSLPGFCQPTSAGTRFRCWPTGFRRKPTVASVATV